MAIERDKCCKCFGKATMTSLIDGSDLCFDCAMMIDTIPEVSQIEFLSGKTINPNCPECKGTGKYTGFNKVEYCRTCITGGEAP